VPTVYRVIVGATGSPGSLRALRYAQHLARDCDATLMPVLAWLPPDGDLADRRTPNEEVRRIWAQDAHQKLQDTLNLAWGTRPPTCRSGPWSGAATPGLVLAGAACRPGDLLLVGAGRRGTLARTGGQVSRYCRVHASCPVLTVPPPPLAHEAPRGALARAFWRRALTHRPDLAGQTRSSRLADPHPQARYHG
jgi:nucleotide-binding universal stress UspA family protein